MLDQIVGIVALVCAASVALFVLTGVVSSFVRVLREYERLVVFRLGRCIGVRGLVW